MKWDLNNVYVADSIEAVKDIPNNFIHLILSDIPYGIGADHWDVLHHNTNSAYLGTSPAQLKAGAVFKRRGKPINGWSKEDRKIPEQYYQWCSLWAKEWYRILKPGGSAIVFAGRRYAHRCITALEDAGFVLKDMIAWIKDQAPHRAQRVSVIYQRRRDFESAKKWEGWRVGNLKPTFEPILWLFKPYKLGGTIADNLLEHGVGAFNEKGFLKYASGPENVLRVKFSHKESGLHPTQKPVSLMKALIELTTSEGHVVLDPFCGSGSTLVAAKQLNRKFLGFDISKKYVQISLKRLSYPQQVELLKE